MRRYIVVMIISIAVLAGKMSQARCYEPPINFFFIIHVEPLIPNGNYPLRAENMARLVDLLNTFSTHPKMTVLMNGDFIERVISEGDSEFFRDLELLGHELGSHMHNIIQLGPYNWTDVGNYTSRYGRPTYDSCYTYDIWNDCTYQLSRLTPNYHSVCACPFLCSTEGELAQQFGYIVMPGNRSEKCLDYTGNLMRHPMRCGANNMYGHELEEDLNSPIIYLDHYAQIGNEIAHGYNCTLPAMMSAVDEVYQEWSERESSNLDSLDYYVWTFGFLTHLQNIDDYYLAQIEMFIDFLEENYVGQYSANGNLIGRFATSWEIACEFMEWENSHPGWSSFNCVYEFPSSIKINEIMYKPEGLQSANEWVELYNPTEQTYDLSGWKLRGAIVGNFWRFEGGTIEPGQYIVVANNGQAFFDQYGFYPDYEASGNTPAMDLYTEGALIFHDEWDALILQNTDPNAPETELNWVDIYSYGCSWYAGFCDTNIVEEGHSIARDSTCTDTDTQDDWAQDGAHAHEPTPGQRNYFALNVNTNDIAPMGFILNGNYPNPFNDQTAFKFNMNEAGEVCIEVYNITGQLVFNKSWGNLPAGMNIVQLSLAGYAAGVYPYIIHLEETSIAGKMVLVR